MSTLKFSIVLCVLLALSWATACEVEESVVDRCFESGKCDGTSVGAPAVEDVEECIEFCQENEQCNFISFNLGNKGCLQLRDCNKLLLEEAYISSSKKCSLSPFRCFEKLECEDAEIISDEEDIFDLNACYQLCNEQENCSYYQYNEEASTCLTLDSCPQYGESADQVTNSVFCSLEEHNCGFKNQCAGSNIKQLSSPSVEMCFHYCLINDECEWFVQNDETNFCDLYRTCEMRLECDTCTGGKKDCPNDDLPNAVLHLGQSDEGYSLSLSHLGQIYNPNRPPFKPQPNDVFLPEELELADLDVACWSSQEQIAVFCKGKECYHYWPREDEWSESVTKLLAVPKNVTEAICTELPSNKLLITGLNGAPQLIKPSVESPPNESTATTLDDDGRTGHCAILLNETHMFLGFGSKRGAQVVNIQNWEKSEIMLEEISVTEFGCALVKDPHSGHDKIMIVGGAYDNFDDITEDYTGLLMIDTEEWNFDVMASLPNEVHVPHSVRGTKLPVFIAKSLRLHGSSYLLLFKFPEKPDVEGDKGKWVEVEDPDFWPQNDFFGFALQIEEEL